MADERTVTRDVAAPADRVWALVSDVTRMGEWSPETEKGTWLGGATTAKPGAKFRGANRNGKKRWSTLATIIDVDPGRQFAFRVTSGRLRVAEWRYSLEPTSNGCRVTESWTDLRGPVVRTLGKFVSGVDDRAEHNRQGMEATLERLKLVAEATPTSA